MSIGRGFLGKGKTPDIGGFGSRTFKRGDGHPVGRFGGLATRTTCHNYAQGTLRYVFQLVCSVDQVFKRFSGQVIGLTGSSVFHFRVIPFKGANIVRFRGVCCLCRQQGLASTGWVVTGERFYIGVFVICSRGATTGYYY